jgi:hypothetical protein
MGSFTSYVCVCVCVCVCRGGGWAAAPPRARGSSARCEALSCASAACCCSTCSNRCRPSSASAHTHTHTHTHTELVGVEQWEACARASFYSSSRACSASAPPHVPLFVLVYLFYWYKSTNTGRCQYLQGFCSDSAPAFCVSICTFVPVKQVSEYQSEACLFGLCSSGVTISTFVLALLDFRVPKYKY